jgi:hypothetical protein
MAKALRPIILPYGLKRKVAEVTGANYNTVLKALRGGYVTRTELVMTIRETAVKMKYEV